MPAQLAVRWVRGIPHVPVGITSGGTVDKLKVEHAVRSFSAECVPDESTKYPLTTVVTDTNPGHRMAEHLPRSTNLQPQAYPRATGARPKCLRQWWTGESSHAVVVSSQICCVAHPRYSNPRYVMYKQSPETGSGMHKPIADPQHSHGGLWLRSQMEIVSSNEEGR